MHRAPAIATARISPRFSRALGSSRCIAMARHLLKGSAETVAVAIPERALQMGGLYQIARQRQGFGWFIYAANDFLQKKPSPRAAGPWD